MPCRNYNDRYMITFISFSFMLWIQEDQTAAKAIMHQGPVEQTEVKTMTKEEQKALLKRLRANMPEKEKFLTGDTVFAIIGKKEPKKFDVAKEIPLIEKKLTKIERKLNSSLFVRQNDLQEIGSELYGSVQKELGELPQQEEETASLRAKAIALAEQLRMFEILMRIENAFHTSIYEKRIDAGVITNVEKELKNINSRETFQDSSSFKQRMANIEQLVEQQKKLLAMAPEQRVQEEVAKMERYLMVLENAIKKDDVNQEVVKYIRISIDEMTAPQKLNFPDPQKTVITERINKFKQLLDIFDNLLHMQIDVQQSNDLSEAKESAVKLRDVQKKLEQLGLPNELLRPTNKHIASVNNSLVPKLFEFLDQLSRESADAIATLDQLKEVEDRFALLKSLRDNLDVTNEQNLNIAAKFVEIESLLNQQRASLLEQQKQNEEFERIALEHKRARQMELQRERDQVQEQWYRELEKREEEERKAKEQRERQDSEFRQKIVERQQKIVERQQKIDALLKEIKKLESKLHKQAVDWIKSQDEEVESRKLHQRLRNLYPDLNQKKYEEKLKILRNGLEERKEFIGSFFYDVNKAREAMLNLRKMEDADNKDLIPLLTEWTNQLLKFKTKLLQERHDLEQINEQKKEKDFVRRNEFVIKDISAVIKRIDEMYKDDSALLLLIENAIKERNRPKKSATTKTKKRGF